MLTIFRVVYLCATALCLAAAGLVTASLFMPDRAPESGLFLGISLAVIGFFIALGLLLDGIRRHVAGIADAARTGDDRPGSDLATHTTRLVVHLLLGGILLCAILGVPTYAILARIDQGFAVFG